MRQTAITRYLLVVLMIVGMTGQLEASRLVKVGYIEFPPPRVFHR